MEEQKEVIPKSNKGVIIQVIFLIVLIVAICSLIYATITIYKYKDMLQNPLGYNMDKYELNYCTCYKTDGTIVPIKSTNYNNVSDYLIPKPEYKPYSPQELNLTLTP